MRAGLCIGAIALLVVGSVACQKAKPSVLLISIDSLRQDVLDQAAGGEPVAPRLVAFRAESAAYSRAISSAPWTSPSMMSIMTGMPSPAHGVEEHDRALASSVATLAERFKSAGYATRAVAPAITLRPEYGFGRGFDAYDFEPLGHDVVTSPLLTGKVLHHLDLVAKERFFVWVHFWDPHYNYIPPSPYDQRFRAGEKPEREDVQCLKWIESPLAPAEAEYLHGQWRGEVAYTDRHVGEILDHLRALGRENDTIVVIVGDHGEAFQEHGWLGHTSRVDGEMIGVPLMIRWPGHVVRASLGTPVETAQLGRTLLTLAGLPAGDFGLVAGLPLQPDEKASAPPALSETVRMGCFTGLTGERFKYQLDQRSCTERLFDLTSDPEEQHDIAAEDPVTLQAMRSSLKERLAAIRDAGVPHAALPPELVNEAEAALRSIGYVAGGTGDGNGHDIVCAPLPDPSKVKVDAFGDAEIYKPCPHDGAWVCLGQIEAGAQR